MSSAREFSPTIVLADDHALVDLGARADEHRAALLQVREREAGRRSLAVGDE
jgi:hypothetical protein